MRERFASPTGNSFRLQGVIDSSVDYRPSSAVRIILFIHLLGVSFPINYEWISRDAEPNEQHQKSRRRTRIFTQMQRIETTKSMTMEKSEEMQQVVMETAAIPF